MNQVLRKVRLLVIHSAVANALPFAHGRPRRGHMRNRISLLTDRWKRHTSARVLLIGLFVTPLCLLSVVGQASEGGSWFSVTPGGYGQKGDQKFAYPLALRVGGTISPHVRLGAEGYMAIVNGYSWEAFGNLSAIILVSPMRS